MRAFDLLTRAEYEIRSASQPRYHLEMALLRWIHLRKLVSIEDLIAGNSPASAQSATAGKARPVAAAPVAPRNPPHRAYPIPDVRLARCAGSE